MLVRHREGLVGLVVDEVADVRALDVDASAATNAAHAGGAIVRGVAVQREYVEGQEEEGGTESERENGAVVVLDLDALINQVFALVAHDGHARRSFLSHTVLVCDDAIFMRTMVGDILTQAGFEIVGEAETGVQAVEKYRELRPDLVTMDIVMPDMGGIDAVREICKLDPNARILMCSAMGQQALVVEAIQAGAKDFVVKPFQPSRVLEAVQRVLG